MRTAREGDSTGMDLPRRRRRLTLPFATILLVGVAAFVLVWFQPQKLLIDERADEEVPGAAEVRTTGGAASAESNGSTPVASAEPVELSRGEFISRDHGTSGVARILELADGRRIVRLEALDTDNGPDLFIYLGTNPAGGDESAFDDEFVNLGRLKANKGDQNYDLPPATDVERFATVVIWCDRFNSAFGAADLKRT